jgi:hypothetical protein
MKEKPDVIVSVFPDAYFCWIALICSWLTRRPYFTYFHNTYKENRTGFDLWIANKIQRIFFNHSKLIFVMSDGLKRFYEKTYPSILKFRTLPHTFLHWTETGAKITDKGIVNLAFTGNFNDSNMESTIRMVNALKILPGIKMNFYTPVPKALLRLRGLDVESINYVGYLPEDDYRKALMENDIMVLTHGFTGGYSAIEYETIFPTRTIELMLTGKPLLAHAPQMSFLAEYLLDKGCAIVVTDPQEETLRRELVALIKDKSLQMKKVEKAKRCLLSFYGPTVVSQWRSQLSEALNP